MVYEITYKCVNCFVKWREVVSKELLEDHGSKYEVMSRDWLYQLFRGGIEIHHCNIWLNQEKIDGTTSYGNVLSIRPIREEE
jgi:hypothetical protein